MPNLRRHPLLPALAAALLSQLVLIGLLRPSPSPGAARPSATGKPNQPADDTPELLRLSRNLLQSSTTPNPGINQLLTLPLPPPPDLTPTPPTPTPSQPKPQRQPASKPAAAKATQPSKPRPAATPRKPRASATKPVAAPGAALPGQLPGQPALALELAKAIATGRQALPAEGASPAQVALQRRQWWLSAQDADQLQRAWDQAEVADRPEAWSALPAGGLLRRVDRQALGPLAAGEANGRSLVNREQITLLWGSGAQLWLLRLPFPGN
jgi:hypothetical protein